MRRVQSQADEDELKFALAKRLNELIASRGISQSVAASFVGMTQAKISQISRYRLANISLSRLLRALVAFGQQVEILVRPSPGPAGASVRVEA